MPAARSPLPATWESVRNPRSRTPGQLRRSRLASPLPILLAEDNLVNQLIAHENSASARNTKLRWFRQGWMRLRPGRRGTGFDLILIDNQMPEMSGLEAVERIRRARIGSEQTADRDRGPYSQRHGGRSATLSFRRNGRLPAEAFPAEALAAPGIN